MKIAMTLLSDAIPGTGESLAGVVDRDIAHDEYGIPYIPAKRMKGILRESAEELRLENIEAIFGRSGQTAGCSFILDNGIIDGYEDYRALLSGSKSDSLMQTLIPRELVLDYFTYLRAQTSIDAKTKTAKSKSLRLSRVLRRGLRFEFPFSCREEDEDVLKMICRATRSFGASRTRGFGQIRLELIEGVDSVEVISKPAMTEKGDRIALDLKLTNDEQLLTATRPGASQTSESYIPGATLLGALAAEYLRINHEASDEFHNIFLSGRLLFSNCYPACFESDSPKIFYPAPLCVRRVKDCINADQKEYVGRYLDLSSHDEAPEAPRNELMLKGGLPSFVTKELDHGLDIRKAIEAHHRRATDRGVGRPDDENGGAFFQFEVIEPGHDFFGTIIGGREQIETLLDFFPKNGILRIGKSKTGQYGRCHFSVKGVRDISESDPEPWLKGEELSFILRSDMILLNPLGLAVPDPQYFASALSQRLGGTNSSLTVTKCYIATVRTGGYLGVWRMPRLCKPALGAGSVISLRNDGDQDLFLPALEEIAFGDRVEDGFGRIDLYESKPGLTPSPKTEIERQRTVLNFNKLGKASDLLRFNWMRRVRDHLAANARQRSKAIGMNSFLGKVLALLSASSNACDFNARFAQFKLDKSRSTIKSELWIEENQNLKDNIKCKLIGKINSDKALSSEQWGISVEDLTAEEQYSLYVHYAQTYLTQVKLSNRQEKLR